LSVNDKIIGYHKENNTLKNVSSFMPQRL